MKLAIAILTLTITSFAQTVVVPLSPEDAAHVKSVKEQVDAVNKLWETLQKEIGKKYLVVEKDSPDAGDRRWHPEDDKDNFFTFSGIAGVITIDNGCLRSPEEQAAHEKAFNEATENKKKLEATREAKSKRIHKGFGSETDFIFSDDWRYLLPKPPTTSPYNSNQWYITPTGTATPGGLLTGPGIVAQ